jgi:hypothetical protein
MVRGPNGATKSVRLSKRAPEMFPVSARGSRAHFGGLADFILRAGDQQSLKPATARPPLPAREPRTLQGRSNSAGLL